VKIPRKDNVVAAYAMTEIKGTNNGLAAKAFIVFVTSKTGQRILARFGFLSP
jgi:ABC-type Fe3+ transport system substrate-binding protein